MSVVLDSTSEQREEICNDRGVFGPDMPASAVYDLAVVWSVEWRGIFADSRWDIGFMEFV